MLSFSDIDSFSHFNHFPALLRVARGSTGNLEGNQYVASAAYSGEEMRL